MPPTVPSLVAPAGSPGALRAAVQYGADAVYLGLRHLSARAHATNFALEQLGPAVELAHHHGCEVLVTLNTLLRSDELPLAARLLRACQDAGVDAVVLQDLGMIELARRVAPGLRLHGSTQLAVHSAEGAAAAARLGLARVVLARELSLDSIAAIGRACPEIELEVFVHGSLCYAYSGLCLASAMAGERRRGRASRGRSLGGEQLEPSLAMHSARSFSGNRGRCTQPCRRPYHSPGQAPGALGLPFSLRDLVGLDLVPSLAETGIAALKIEGRLRSPSYVAAVCHAYRGALDLAAGREPPPGWEPEEVEMSVRSQFSRRPSTGYLLGGAAHREGRTRHPPVKVQPVMQGHLGPRVGRVLGVDQESVLAIVERPFRPGARLLTPDREGTLRHLELPWLQDEQGRGLERAEPGTAVRLPLPRRFRPQAGGELRLAHSPWVAERFRVEAPRLLPRGFAGPAVELDIVTTEAALEIEARAGGCAVRDRYVLGPEPVDALRAPTIEQVMATPERASTLGAIHCTVTEDQALRTPRKALVRVRRDILRRLELALELRRLEERYPSGARDSLPPSSPTPLPQGRGERGTVETWTLRSDDPALLVLGPPLGFTELELVLDPAQPERLDRTLAMLDPSQLACALPPVLLGGDRDAVAAQIHRARQAGVGRWVLSNLGHGALVGARPDERRWGDDLLYAANPLARARLASLLELAGVDLPLELDRQAATPMLRHGHDRVVLFADVAVFRAALAPHLPGHPRAEPILDELGHPYLRARQGRSAVLVDGIPLCLAEHLGALRELGARRFRVDLCWRERNPDEARDLLELLRAGRAPAGVSGGNWTRRWL